MSLRYYDERCEHTPPKGSRRVGRPYPEKSATSARCSRHLHASTEAPIEHIYPLCSNLSHWYQSVLRNAPSDKKLQTGIATVDSIPCPVVRASERVGDDVADRGVLAIWPSGQFRRDGVVLWLPIRVVGDVGQVKKVRLDQVCVESGIDGVTTFAICPNGFESEGGNVQGEKRFGTGKHDDDGDIGSSEGG